VRYLVALLLVAGVVVGCTTQAPNVPPPLPVTLPTVKPLVTAHITVVGDSYVDQVWTGAVEQQLHNVGGIKSDLQNGGAPPGSGYVTRSHESGGAVLGEKAEQLVRPDDALVVFVGSHNDGNAQSLPKLGTTVHDVFARAKQTAPQAKLLVIGPIYPEGDPPPEVLQARDIMANEATAVGATFADPIAGKWLGGQPTILKADGVLTQDGDIAFSQIMLSLITKEFSSAGQPGK
jgi:hypothetical protein